MPKAESKIKERSDLSSEVRDWIAEGETIGFTSGAFDILHVGHVTYLEEAKSRCDRLIVGLNSDSSIRSYKSKDRPVVSERDRARVLAALSFVDYVFTFDEDNNNQNIELLKPSIYFKAGDYDESQLSSAPKVRSYGGDVQIIAFEAGYSTTDIITKIESGVGIRCSTSLEGPRLKRQPAVFLDRDGTLIEHVQYLHDPAKVAFFDKGLEPLKLLQSAGYRLVIVTNQPGIGLGYFSEEDFYRVNLEVFKEASRAGVLFDKVYFSPFGKASNTDCRKPGRALIDRAVTELNLDLEQSVVIGDTTTDMQLAKNIGCMGILVKTGYAGTDGVYDAKGDYQVAGLGEAVDLILEKTKED